MKTTRWIRPVKDIADIEAIEEQSYEELVPAKSVYDLFCTTAALFPERPGLTFIPPGSIDSPAHTRSNLELLQEITQVANMLSDLVTKPSSVIAILSPTYDQIPTTIWGAETAAVVSCINYLLAPDVIAELLLSEEAEVLIVPGSDLDREIWLKAQVVIEKTKSIKKILVLNGVPPNDDRMLDFDLTLQQYPKDRLVFSRDIQRDTIAALFHTGGTTGTPKLVKQTHGNQIHAAWAFAQMWALDETDVILHCLPMFHVGGTISQGLSFLGAGAHIVILSPYGLRNSLMVENYWKLIERYSATIVGGVPTAIYAIADVPIGSSDISSVRMGITGGALCPAAVAERFEARTGKKLYEQYGMTETAAMISTGTFHGESITGSVGFRVPFSDLIIAKEDTGENEIVECDPEEIGLVLVRGPQVFPGYKNRQHNAGVLLKDGWLATGDLGYLTTEKRLILTGRKKDLIIRSGHNIDPLIIEETANTFPGVQLSAAVGMLDEYAGEVPVLFVVKAFDQPLDIDGLERHMAEHIAEPPAKPRKIFEIDDLPTTVVGKIYKPALRELAAKEKIRQEIEKQTGPGSIIDLKTSMQKSGTIEAVVVLDWNEEEGDKAEIESSLFKAFVDLPIELKLQWN